MNSGVVNSAPLTPPRQGCDHSEPNILISVSVLWCSLSNHRMPYTGNALPGSSQILHCVEHQVVPRPGCSWCNQWCLSPCSSTFARQLLHWFWNQNAALLFTVILCFPENLQLYLRLQVLLFFGLQNCRLSLPVLHICQRNGTSWKHLVSVQSTSVPQWGYLRNQQSKCPRRNDWGWWRSAQQVHRRSRVPSDLSGFLKTWAVKNKKVNNLKHFLHTLS